MGQNGTKEKLQCVADYRLAVHHGTSASDICEKLKLCFRAGGAPFTFDDIETSSELLVETGKFCPTILICACAVRCGDVTNCVEMYERMVAHKDLHSYAIKGYYKGIESSEFLPQWQLDSVRDWVAGKSDRPFDFQGRGKPYDWDWSGWSSYVFSEYIPSLRILAETCDDSLRVTAVINLLVTCWATGKLDFSSQLRRVLSKPSEEVVAARAELEAAKAKLAQAILGDMERS